MPRTAEEDWYYFWPDWPTGTLRVEFTRFTVPQLFFVDVCVSRALELSVIKVHM